MPLRRFLRGILFFCFLAGSLVSHAQGPAENLAASAEEQFRNGNYKRSAEIYKEFIGKYPTSQLIFSVRYQYGLSLLLDGQYEPAIKVLEDLAKPSTPAPELREQARLLLGNAYGGLAVSRPKSERAALLKSGLDAFNQYLKEYRQKGISVPDAVYGRAALLFEMENFDQAIADLEKFPSQFPDSQNLLDAQQLLAKVYAAKASKLFKDKKTADADAMLKLAENCFEKVGGQGKNPVMSNEAFFAAGKTFLDFEQYDKSLDFFRRVRPKEELIGYQRARVDQLREQRMAMIRESGKENSTMKSDIQRETSKLNRLLGRYDLYLASQQYIAQVFLAQQKYDESLIVNQHYLPFFDEDLAKLAQYQIVGATIGKKDFAGAEELAVAFADKYKDDPIGDDLFFRLAEKILALGQFDKGLQLLELSLQKYPNGSYAESSLLTRGSVLTQLDQTDKAAEEYARFMKLFPNSPLIDRALYLRGLNYQKQGKFDLAVKDFKDILSAHADSKYKEDAYFRIGVSLSSIGKHAEAIEHLTRFEKLYPKSQLLAAVLYQLGLACEGAGKFDQAIQTHQRNAKDFPKDEMAPYSLFSIGVIYYNQRRYEEMDKAFQDYIAKYPSHKNVGDAQNLMAYASQVAKKYDKAIQLYGEVVSKNPGNETGARAQLSLGLCYLFSSTDKAIRPNSLPAPEKEEWDGNLKKAVDAFSSVITAYPKSNQVDEALSNLVTTWKYRIDSALATKEDGHAAFKKLTESVGTERLLVAKIQFTYGAFLFERGDVAESLPVFDDAYAASSGTTLPVESYKKYLAALMSNEPPNSDKAIAVAQKLISENQASPLGLGEGYYWLGRAYFEKGDVTQADSYFEKVGKISEVAGTELDGHVKLFQGQIFERKKNYDEAIKIYTELQKSMPVKFRVEPIMRMGYAFEGKGDPASLESALKKFQEVMINFEGSGRDAEALFKAGEIATKLKHADDARKRFDKLKKEFPNNKWTQAAVAKGYIK